MATFPRCVLTCRSGHSSASSSTQPRLASPSPIHGSSGERSRPWVFRSPAPCSWAIPLPGTWRERGASGCATFGWRGTKLNPQSRAVRATAWCARSGRWRRCCDGEREIVSGAGRDRLHGGIIAAGDGSRLRRDGFAVPKPMVEVAGVSLIEAVVRNFGAAGIASLVVIVNERDAHCATWVRERFPHLDIRFIVKTTASSLESFREVTAVPEGGPMLVSTVDAWCRPADFARFAKAAMERPAGSVVLAVTPLVADEKPLWVDLDPDGRVRALGGATGAFVTAGLYLVPERVRRLTPPGHLGRLRELLMWLHAQGEPMFGQVIPAVVDVDRAEDVAL